VLQIHHVARVQACPDRGCEWSVAADGESTGPEVLPQQVVRLSVPSLEEGFDGGVVKAGLR
jgi:hypothetical protein